MFMLLQLGFLLREVTGSVECNEMHYKSIKHYGPYSQRDIKPRLTKHDFNDFPIGDKIDT